MKQGQQIEPEAHRLDYYEDEIELIDLLKVIWKWKYLILVGTIACAVGAAVISLNMTKIYRVNISFSPGIVGITETGNYMYIDTIQNIQTLIQAGTFDEKIMQTLDVPDGEKGPESLKLNCEIPRGLNVVNVFHETSYPEVGMQSLSILGELLRERYASVVEYHKKQFDLKQKKNRSELEKIDRSIADRKAEMAATKEKIKNLIERQSVIRKQIDQISKNTDILIADRKKFLSSHESEENVLSSLLYTNTIQQNISYLDNVRAMENNLESSIRKAGLRIEKKSNVIKDLEGDKRFISEEIIDLELEKNRVQNVQILQPPKRSRFPIKPKKTLNVILATAVGLLTTLLLAFFFEYISRYRTKTNL
jgi:capsular polysaccharide biosynthesis protein